MNKIKFIDSSNVNNTIERIHYFNEI